MTYTLSSGTLNPSIPFQLTAKSRAIQTEVQGCERLDAASDYYVGWSETEHY